MNKRIELGDTMPDFFLPGIDGKNYDENDFGANPLLLIIFSCNHCPYVQAYEERIIKLQNNLLKDGLKIVAINANDSDKYSEDSFEEMKKRATEKEFNFIYLRDESQETAKAFGAAFTPELFLFNAERKLIYTGKIDDNWREPEKVQTKYLQNAIEEFLRGEEISVPETYAIGCTIKWKAG
ncbi:MAG: thioredoxin family protein [Ignavibacteria bacterium]|nr:thioredoxin family protein [Ignavibacteria bacterium]